MSNKKADKLDVLMNSALQLFAQKGYHNTKIKDITDNASVAAGTFYLYFKNKDDLIDKILQKYLTDELSKFKVLASKDIPAIEKLNSFIKSNIEFLFQNKNFLHIHIEQFPICNNTHPVIKYNHFIQEYLSILEIILKQGQTENLFSKDINLKIAARSLRGIILVNSVMLIIFNDNETIDKDELIKNICHIFIKGIKK